MRFFSLILWLLTLSIMLAVAACSGKEKAGALTSVDSTFIVAQEEPKVLEWHVGDIVTIESFPDIESLAHFTARELNDSIFEIINGNSFNGLTPVDRSDLRYLRLLHIDFEGHTRMGELICNKAIALELCEIFRELFEDRYPIGSIRLVEDFNANDEESMAANNTSCFNTRGIGGGHQLSKHAYGLAVDINPLYNPLVKVRNGRTIVQPSAGVPFANRSDTFPGKIDREDLAYRLFTGHGFRWGGAWRSVKDYQHFEKR